MRKFFFWFGFVLVLLIINLHIISKVKIAKSSQEVFIELSESSSFIYEGDYIYLDYNQRIFPEAARKNIGYDSRIVARIDSDNQTASFSRVDDRTKLAFDEVFIRYRFRKKPGFKKSEDEPRLIIGPKKIMLDEDNAFDIEEPRYAGFKLSKNGNTLFTGLVDEDMEKLEAMGD